MQDIQHPQIRRHEGDLRQQDNKRIIGINKGLPSSKRKAFLIINTPKREDAGNPPGLRHYEKVLYHGVVIMNYRNTDFVNVLASLV